MKKTNSLITLYAGIIASILVSTSSAASIPTSELLKAEPVNQSSLKSVAQDNLMQSFSIIEVKSDFSENKTATTLAHKKVQAKQNKPLTLTRTNRVAD
jgi:hypothetical protein